MLAVSSEGQYCVLASDFINKFWSPQFKFLQKKTNNTQYPPQPAFVKYYISDSIQVIVV